MEKCPDLCSSESSLELIQTLPHVFFGQSTCVKGEYGLVRVQEKIKIRKNQKAPTLKGERDRYHRRNTE